ncbi:MarR family winged helix-turn-helix transcriptional regulator [Actinoplanes teichomyceticus]|uniref:MarR family protein n=1 Tax=Actinoplanes teichomyceticus TaxID=1867 RepID=A0A561WQW5_ACTTI|nr:MarR family winged helix-turn-helix transcriptional regulator [Actinoplanes teichomyceticus]TWG26228.1 MarR family protein [Actinoplanes teichomyceticus]GIF11307.1 MarR family transcriptional regulator [Actinoplanes teichomyceticus]
MTPSGGTDRHRLLATMHEVIKAVRLLKQDRPPTCTGVPVGTVGVLSEIRARETTGCHAKELAAGNALDPSTISRAVAALVRAGLVVRSADPADGRASTLHLTDQGRNVLDAAQAHYQARFAAALHDWSPEEINAFTASLQRFARDLIDQHTHAPELEAAR